jgi:hypothetical protein
VHCAIAFLRERGVAVVGLSAHDSCAWSLAQFAAAVGRMAEAAARAGLPRGVLTAEGAGHGRAVGAAR